MQLKTILNTVEKHKSFVDGEARWSENKTAREIEFDVQPRKNSKPICSGCNRARPGYDRRTARRFEYVALWAIPVFLVDQLDEGLKRLLYVARDCTEASLNGFFDILNESATRGIQFACAEMLPAYLKVLKARASQALNILDRFHIMKKFGDALDKIRAEEARQMKQDGYEEVLKNSRWCLLKRRANLTKKQPRHTSKCLFFNTLKQIPSRILVPRPKEPHDIRLKLYQPDSSEFGISLPNERTSVLMNLSVGYSQPKLLYERQRRQNASSNDHRIVFVNRWMWFC